MDHFVGGLFLHFSPAILFIGGTFLLHQIVFWSFSLPLLFLDLTQTPALLYKYKIQSNHQVTWNEVNKCLKTVLINQFFVMLPCNIILYYTVVAYGYLDMTTSLPSWYLFLYFPRLLSIYLSTYLSINLFDIYLFIFFIFILFYYFYYIFFFPFFLFHCKQVYSNLAYIVLCINGRGAFLLFP